MYERTLWLLSHAFYCAKLGADIGMRQSWRQPLRDESAGEAWAQPVLDAAPCAKRPCEWPKYTWSQPSLDDSSSAYITARRNRGRSKPSWTQLSIDEATPRLASRGPAWRQPRLERDDSACEATLQTSRRKRLLEVDVCLGSLLLAVGRPATANSYARNGEDERRIAAVLSRSCVCKRTCDGGISVDQAVQFCQLFRRCTVAEQRCFWSILVGNAGGVGNSESGLETVEWRFLGKRVCVARLVAILGMTKRTLYKLVRADVDKRQFNGRTKSLARKFVDQFFFELYHSCAEHLPEDDGLVGVDDAIAGEEFNSDGEPDNPQRPETQSSESRVHMPSWDPAVSFPAAFASHCAGERLPMKKMHHQKFMDLWWLYLAWLSVRSNESSAASLATFWRSWDEYWRACLVFRKSSQHAQCDVCNKYTQYVHFAHADAAEKQRAAQNWQEHLRDQYRDRLIYWHLRWYAKRCSTAMPGTIPVRICVIIIDSMDKAKCAWPQYKFRIGKSLEYLRRPRICIHLAIAHGYCCDFFLADDEEMFHGASCFCEVLTRTLARTHKICQDRGLPFPDHLVVQSDNTTSQAKNSEVAKFLAVLVSKGKFCTAVLNFLRVGHTHEDVDQVFGVLLALVLRRVKFQTPIELSRYIQVGMAEVVAARGELLNVEHLTHIRDFLAWMAALGVDITGCWVTRRNMDVPHSFTYKLRGDLTHNEQQRLRAEPSDLGFPLDASDVFCVTKQFMASTEPTGPPVLVLPAGRAQGMIAPYPTGTCYRKASISERRRTELRQLANDLESLSRHWSIEHSYFRAGAALRNLADGRDAERSQDGFLEATAVGNRARVEATDNPYFGHLPGLTFRMVVRFH